MTTYVRARRPSVQFVQDPTIRVNMATMVPDGMHAFQFIDKRRIVDDVVEGLIARGVDPYRARILADRAAMRRQQGSGLGDADTEATLVNKLIASGVHKDRAKAIVDRAYWKVHKKHPHLTGNRGLHRGWTNRVRHVPPPARPKYFKGMGDEDVAAAMLAEVQSRGGEFQDRHAALIARVPSATSDADKLALRNDVDALYNEWTAYAMQVKNGIPPYQWNKLDPVDAILIAVRADIADTSAMMAANKAQAVLAKQIAALPKPGRIPGLPGIDIPRIPEIPGYVWAGAAVVGGAIVGKALHLW